MGQSQGVWHLPLTRPAGPWQQGVAALGGLAAGATLLPAAWLGLGALLAGMPWFVSSLDGSSRSVEFYCACRYVTLGLLAVAMLAARRLARWSGALSIGLALGSVGAALFCYWSAPILWPAPPDGFFGGDGGGDS